MIMMMMTMTTIVMDMVLQLAAASSFPRDDEQADPVAQCKAVGHHHHYEDDRDGDDGDHKKRIEEVLHKNPSSEIVCLDMYPEGRAS